MRDKSLSDFDDEPDDLCRYSFVRRDDESTDAVRKVWYERALDSEQCQLRLVVRIEFELFITDDPQLDYPDNKSYAFNGVFLDVVNRRMERLDNLWYSPETEQPVRVGEFRLEIETLREVNQLAGLLRPRVWRPPF